MRKLLLVLAVLVTAGCSQPDVVSAPPVVADSVSDHALLNDALRVAFDRREFWARTDMVPIDEARWFSDLLERGTAAAGSADRSLRSP